MKTIQEIEDATPDDAIYAAWLQRPDIAELTAEERAAKWEKHMEGLNSFRGFLAENPNTMIV